MEAPAKEQPKEQPKLIVSIGPHMHDEENTAKIMWTVSGALLPATLMSVYYFGMPAIQVILICIVTSLLTDPQIDPVHGNGLAVANDGNLLLSSRNQSEVTKINLQTGEVMWRFGGKANQFKIIGGQPFAFQQSSGNGQSAQRPPTKISLAPFFCRR